MEDQAVEFTIRHVTRDDGPVLAALAENNPDSGDVGLTPRYAHSPYELYAALCPDTAGFLAETPDGEAVGMGFISYQDVRVCGRVRPVGFMRGLVVKEGFRRKGVGTRLARARIEHARRTHGDDCAIVATIQASNDPSLAVTGTWAEKFVYDRSSRAAEPRTTKPDTAGYEVRRVHPDELPRVVDRTNEFYADAELFSPYRADELADRLATAPGDDPLRQYFVALDGEEIVAGVDVVDFHRERVVAVEANGPLPPSVPDSGEIRARRATNLWFSDGHSPAARAVVERIRTDPGGANRLWYQTDSSGAFAALGMDTDLGSEIMSLTTAVLGVDQPLSDRPVADIV